MPDSPPPNHQSWVRCAPHLEGMEEEAHYRSALVCNRRAMRRRRAFAGLLFAYAYALLFVSLSPLPFLPLPFPTLSFVAIQTSLNGSFPHAEV